MPKFLGVSSRHNITRNFQLVKLPGHFSIPPKNGTVKKLHKSVVKLAQKFTYFKK